MRAGQFDRLITIEQKLVVREASYGTETFNWVPFAANVRAQQSELSGIESLRQEIRVMNRRVAFVIRWRDGVTTAMRIAADGRYFQIVNALEIPRRRGLRIECEEYSV